MDKWNMTKPYPASIKRRRSRSNGPKNLHKLEVSSDKPNAQNQNLPKRGRGRPPGTGKWQFLRAQVAMQIKTSGSIPVEPITIAKSALSIERPSKHHFCQYNSEENLHLDAGYSEASAREDIIPNCGSLRNCSSAEVVLIDSSTESSGFPSTCIDPLNGDNGITSIIKAKDERSNASQEDKMMNAHGHHHGDHKCASMPADPLPKGGQSTVSEHKTDCQKETDKKWDSTPLMKAITKRHGDITKSCKFQSELFKTNCLDGVCKAVKKLQETRFADVNSALLKEFYSFIEDAESVNLDVKWLRKNIDEVADAMKSASELQELEDAEKQLRLQNEERRKAIQVKRIEVAKLRSEIELQEEELDLALLSNIELKSQIKGIKSRYCSSEYLMESML